MMPGLGLLHTPPFASKTAVTTMPEEIATICPTDPIDDMHTLSLDEALTSGQPTEALLATPAFCMSRICGTAPHHGQDVTRRVAQKGRDMPTKQWTAALITAVVVAGSLLFSVGDVSTLAHEADGHPARIQRGACDNLGAVAYQLTGVGASITPDGTPIALPETVGAADAHSLQVSETTLDTSLSQLTKDPYAIVVYESDEAMEHILACGNLGGVLAAQMPGMVMPGDVLTIWLPGTEGSSDVGVALLEANGTHAIVRLILAEGLQSEFAPDGVPEEATPQATSHVD